MKTAMPRSVLREAESQRDRASQLMLPCSTVAVRAIHIPPRR
jgi:hypothetical protein